MNNTESQPIENPTTEDRIATLEAQVLDLLQKRSDHTNWFTTALELRAQGMKYKDIAERVDKKVSTVMVRFQRHRDKERTALVHSM